MNPTTEGSKADKILKRTAELLDRLPKRDVSASTAKVYKATMKRMWSDGFDPLRPGDARDTYNLRRSALHFCTRIMLEAELVKIEQARARNDDQAANASIADLGAVLKRLEQAIDRDPPLDPAASSFACPSSRWSEQVKPPRRGKGSKKHVLFKLPADWIDKVWAAAGPGWTYRDALAIHMLTPVRPAEFVPAMREGRWVPGVAVALKGDVLLIKVAPAKSHGGKYGTGESVMRFAARNPNPAVVHLVARCRSAGGGLVVALENTNGMRKSLAKLGRKAVGKDVTITGYVYRHQVIADLKKTVGAGALVAAAAGHSSDRTQGHYGRVERGRRRPEFISAIALRPPVAKTISHIRELAAARRAASAPAMR